MIKEKPLKQKKIPQVELFTSEHCHFCEIMEGFLLDLQKFYNFDIKKVDVGKTPSQNVLKLPTIRINGGKEIVGFMPKEDLSTILVRQLYSKI